MAETDFLNSDLSIGLATAPVQVLLTPNIGVIGVGGAGGNAVNNMIKNQLSGVSFFVANTDAQALSKSLATERIQLGVQTTKGLGAGSNPEIGKISAEESEEKIRECLAGLHLLFITAGMGGGTGTGAAPVIASIAKDMGILTVGVVSKPFKFERERRMKTAEAGIVEMQKYVDTLIIIPNQNLFRIANNNTTFAQSFQMADDVLCQGVRSITDLLMNPGMINLDFADVQTVISGMGCAMMGSAEAEGENRALIAAEKAITNPLLDHASIKGARSILINIAGGLDLTLAEVDAATERITSELPEDANIIFGTCANEELEGKIRISLVATGIPSTTGKENIVPTSAVSTENIIPVPDSFKNPVESESALIVEQNVESTLDLPFDSEPIAADSFMAEPPLIVEEQPVLQPLTSVHELPEEKKAIVEKPEETSYKTHLSSLFDLVPGLNRLNSDLNAASDKKESSEQSSLMDEKFSLPSFFRSKQN